ncbi:MAG TPA: hypothetical protein VJI46_07210 [Candidatus Nanoarchaeia archaeon]|nr:hypothetical protein [Candidatus Nanoarchaeia archaeon]
MKYLIFLAILAAFLIIACKQPLAECLEKGHDVFVAECIAGLAIEKKDASLCSSIANENIRNSCIADVAISKNAASLCSQAGDSTNYCLANVAVNMQNPEGCEQIADAYWSDFCRLEFSKSTLNATHCGLIGNPSSADECFSFIATNQSNPKMCENISYSSRDKCYLAIATNILNVTVCNNINNLASRFGNCYQKIARLSNNPEICRQISIAEIRENCNEILNQNG